MSSEPDGDELCLKAMDEWKRRAIEKFPIDPEPPLRFTLAEYNAVKRVVERPTPIERMLMDMACRVSGRTWDCTMLFGMKVEVLP
jgi:hypothetical protein